MIPGSGKPRLVYLLSRYPAVSHTFFLNEVLGLRRVGFEIETASINSPDRPTGQLPPLEAEEAARTYYLKNNSAVKALGVLAKIALREPGMLIRGLKVVSRLGGMDVRRKLYALFYFVEACLLGEWMRGRSLRHIHVHFGGPVSTVGMIAAEVWGFDYSLTIHGPEEFYEVEESYLPRKIERAKFLFCISDFCRSQLMKYCDAAHWDKMHVLRLGVDVEKFVAAPQSPDLPTLIVCVGRLVPAKGQHILLRAFAQLRAKNCPARLLLIGDGPDRAALEREAAQLQIAAHVEFAGSLNHDETRRRIMSAHIFALASFAEGVPVALMEAMAMRIPCVSTMIAGIPELIRDQVDGLLVPASSVNQLAAAIALLVDDPGLRERLGASARERVIERYNLGKNIERLASAFEECLR
jgi:glycosyltransferase involved in cell wall biosynthesis